MIIIKDSFSGCAAATAGKDLKDERSHVGDKHVQADRGIVFLELFDSFRWLDVAYGNFWHLQLVVCIDFGYFVRVEEKDDAGQNEDEFDDATEVRAVLQPSVPIARRLYHFISQVEVPVFDHVFGLPFQVGSEAVHAVRTVGFVLTPQSLYLRNLYVSAYDGSKSTSQWSSFLISPNDTPTSL